MYDHSNQKGYVPYAAALQLAFKFVLGHKILSTANTSQYRFLRNLETGMLADRMLSEHRTVKPPSQSKKLPKPKKKVSRETGIELRCISNASIVDIDPTELKKNRRKFNIVQAVMRLKMVLMAWKE